MIKELFAIRHKISGEIMPLLEKNRGYSHWNPPKKPTVKEVGVPRILKSRRQAEQVISQWVALPNASYRGYVTSSGEDDYDIHTKDDGRKKEDLEIVPVKLEIKDGND